MPEYDDEPRALHLRFSAVAGAVPGLGVAYYVASIQDAAGLTVLELRLPAALVESVVIDHAAPMIAMSPNGMISVVDDLLETSSKIGNGISVDALIERSVVPEMLEDEIDADRQLDELRDRLKSALLVIDAARSKLS